MSSLTVLCSQARGSVFVVAGWKDIGNLEKKRVSNITNHCGGNMLAVWARLIHIRRGRVTRILKTKSFKPKGDLRERKKKLLKGDIHSAWGHRWHCSHHTRHVG